MKRALETMRRRRKSSLISKETVKERIRVPDEDNSTIVTETPSEDESAPPKPKFSFRTMGGAYHTTLKKSPSCTLPTSEEPESDDEDLVPVKCSWKTCRVTNYHRHSPERSCSVDQESLSDRNGSDKEIILKKKPQQRELPSTWYFSSNHVLVNRERTKRNIPTLFRCSKLDALAREHATAMVRNGDVFLSETLNIVGKHHRLGQNAASGTNIREMHRYMMKKSKGDKNNLLDSRYKNFGMGTAQSPDGRLYLCQIFKG